MKSILIKDRIAELQLLPDKAIYWPEHEALLVADVHLGKAAAFRAHSIAVPGGTTRNDLERLTALINRCQAKQVYILGDMWHAKEGLAPQTMDVIREWREKQQSLNVVLVKGNHDRKCGPLPVDLRIESVDEPLQLGPLHLVHDPHKAVGEYSLAGHIHPCVRLEGAAFVSHRLPCFWFGERVGVLPAFGSFTGCARVLPEENDRVFVIVEGNVIEMPVPRPAHQSVC